MSLDTDLPANLKEGNKDAFVNLYKLYYKPLCKYAFNLLKDLDLAEETVQDIIYKIWERRETLNIPEHLKEYLFKAVFNSCMNQIKNKMNDASQLKQMTYHLTNENPDFKDLIVLKELEDSIKEAIESLPEKSKIVFKMNRFEGLTYADIASKLNITVKGVEYHMSNALKQLAVDLKDYLPLIILILSINFN